MKEIKNRFTPDGILSGYTLVETSDHTQHIHQHEYEFRDMADLKKFLTPHCRSVKVFETIYPSRHNLYFYASDGPIPFHPDWPHQTHDAPAEPEGARSVASRHPSRIESRGGTDGTCGSAHPIRQPTDSMAPLC
jgi:hypothetical protein